jgi:sulfate adenylyltransferase
MSKLVPPHGSETLMPLLVPENERAESLQRATKLRSVPMTSRETSDFLMLAMGAYTPLTGFMGHDDWRGCCEDMTLTSGVFWPIPITLSCTDELASLIAIGEVVALVDEDSGETMGTLEVTEKYAIDKAFECRHVFRTNDPKHPGKAKPISQDT